MKNYCICTSVFFPILILSFSTFEGSEDFQADIFNTFYEYNLIATKIDKKKPPVDTNKKNKEEKAKIELEEKAKREAEEKAKREAEEKAKREAEEKAKREAEEKAKREAEEKAKREAEFKSEKEAKEEANKEFEIRQKELKEKEKKENGLDRVENLLDEIENRKKIAKKLSEERVEQKKNKQNLSFFGPDGEINQKEVMRIQSRIDASLKEIHKNIMKSSRVSVNQDGLAMLTYINSSGLSDDEIYIQIVGINPITGIECFISFDAFGNPTYCDVDHQTNSSEYSYVLSYFPDSADSGGKALNLPLINSARIYTSILSELTFEIKLNNFGIWTINPPDPMNPSDPNRGIIWDKTEFTYDAKSVFINPTAVDSFSLPIFCSEIGKDGSFQSGGVKVSRKFIFYSLANELQKAGGPWGNLLLQDPSIACSMSYGSAVGIFPNNFFEITGWIDAFVRVFSQTELLIDVGESLSIESGGGIWKGSIDTVSNEITFQRVVDENHPATATQKIQLPKLTQDLISGSGDGWKMEPGNLLQPIFARNISCAIDTNTLSTKEVLNKNYFSSQMKNFYQINIDLPGDLQFIDYYSKILHSLGDHRVYTVPYDDELNQGGAVSYPPSEFKAGIIFLGPVF